MARNDGHHRTIVRNAMLTAAQARAAELHNERKRQCYANPDIIKSRTINNVYFKKPLGSYTASFDGMVSSGQISTRGQKPDAKQFCELVFDVNSSYFLEHGGFPFAKNFFAEAYEVAKKIVGGEQYIISAVMHADERNKALSEEMGRDIYHYHLHVVYIPVVVKEVKYSKRCKNPSLIGTVNKTVMQVSASKKWKSSQACDEQGEPLFTASGKPVLHSSYSKLQDNFFEHMTNAGFVDFERGEQNSGEEHLFATDYKIKEEKKRLAKIQAETQKTSDELAEKTNACEKADFLFSMTETLYKQMMESVSEEEEKYKQLVHQLESIQGSAKDYDDDPEKVIPQPSGLESAKTFREKKIKPFLAKSIATIQALTKECLELRQRNKELDSRLASERTERNRYQDQVEFYKKEYDKHSSAAKNYDLLIKHMGQKEIDRILRFEQHKGNVEHTNDLDWER